MKILSIRPKGIYIDLEFSLEEIQKLERFLSNCTVEYNSKEDPDMKTSVDYVTQKFYPDLALLIKNVEKDQWP